MAAFRLFGRTLPIHFALLGWKRKCIKSTTTAKLTEKRTSIAAVRDKLGPIDTFPTPLLSRCRLPLSCWQNSQEKIKRIPVAKGLQSRNEIILNGPDPGLILFYKVRIQVWYYFIRSESRDEIFQAQIRISEPLLVEGKNSHTYEVWKLEIVNDRPDSGRKALKHAH